MLKELLSRKKKDDSSSEKRTGNFREVPEEDMLRYEFQDLLFQIIFKTETALHNEEDPLEIAIGVMKAACELYDADWCGILTADLQTQVFIPEIWYEVGLGPMKETLFNEVEFTEEFATWVKHLMDQEPLVIPDIEAIRKTNPKEYEAYKRLDARSIVGVPFGQHPLGFMVVRNVKRYAEQYQPLQLACFVAMMMLEQIRRARMEKVMYVGQITASDGNDKITHEEWLKIDLFTRLSQSKFRMRFQLKEADRRYIQQKGMDVIRSHAEEFVKKRLAPAVIPNDGKQTPMRGAPNGHPVFLGQHATATCCRGCLEKWYGIPKGRELTETEQKQIVDVLMTWICKQTDDEV